jgi:hypothetical protein
MFLAHTLTRHVQVFQKVWNQVNILRHLLMISLELEEPTEIILLCARGSRTNRQIADEF